MWIVKLAWKNIWRNKGRTAISISAVFFAVVLSAVAESLKQGVFDNLVRNIVSLYTGYIQLHKKGYQEEQTLDNSFSLSEIPEDKIKAVAHISNYTPRLESFALASSGELTKGCMVTGIMPENENNITALKSKLIRGEYLKDSDVSVMMTQGLAERLNLRLNDTVILIAQGYHGTTSAARFPVKGILKFGSPQLNDKLMYMSLKNAQSFFDCSERATSYILALDNNKKLSTATTDLRKLLGRKYEIMSWEELMPEIKQHIETDSSNMKVVQMLLYFLISFGIFGTLLMMVMERKFEMGLLHAIGMKKQVMMLLFATESVLTVFTGCIAGLIAALPFIYYLKKNPIRMTGETAKAYERFGFEAIFPASTNASIFIFQTLTVLVIGLVLSLYPIIKVAGLNVVNAMKK